MKLIEFMKSKAWKRISVAVKCVAIVFTAAFYLVSVGGNIMLENELTINAVLDVETSRVEEDENAAEQNTEYYSSSYNSVSEVQKSAEEMIVEVMEEGATLLKNENYALPLSSGDKVSLYSVSSVDPVITGTGSSGSSNILPNDNFTATDFKTAFENVGLKVNSSLWNFYNSNKSTYARKKSGSWGAYFSISDAPWDKIPNSAKEEGYNGTAIFVLSRRSGEGNDMASYYGDEMVKQKWNLTNDMTNGNYLALSPNEISVLKGLNELKNQGKIDNIVVLMNSANPVQCDFVDDPQYGVDALLWCGNIGETGAEGVANLLTGKATPSGRLSDTFWKYHYKNPVNANFASDMYTTNQEWTEHVPITWLDQEKIDSSDEAMYANMVSSSRNTVYAEGIYVGYRYTETRYEDYVFGRENTGEFDYYDTVSYPFGYGLSYTTFEYSDFKVSRVQQTAGMDDSVYNISVRVTNTGKIAAKEVVQLYLQKPYTEDYDEYWGIEKASVELVDFAKTDVIQPNDDRVITFTVNERELASYDAKNYKTYILEDGDYYFTAAKDAHDAVNNIIASKSEVTDIVNPVQYQGNTGAGDKDLAVKCTVEQFDGTIYSTSTKALENNIKTTATTITNQFDQADILYYEGATDGFRYVTRSDWEGTVKYGFDENGECLKTQVKVTITDEMYEDRKDAMSDPEPDGGEYPAMGVNNDPSSSGHLNLIDLRAYSDDDDDPTNNEKIKYNDKMWDKLLDQLSWDELTSLLSNGWRLTGGIESIAKPETIDFNGSVGLVTTYDSGGKTNRGLAVTLDDPDKGEMIPFYPCNGICAATFNKELMYRYGEQWGEDSLWSGVSGLYGMGVNLHRSPYGGRNFEYYSEDPVLTGKVAAETVKGMASRGNYSYLKHCVLNEQESYRIGGYNWINEQTMREIYLKAFQIPIEEGGASCVMTAEPAIGVKWSGQQGFVQTVLRDEFGMTGIAVSDYTRDVDGNYLKALLAGSDLPDGSISDLFDGISSTEGYGDLATAMRESAHRILYTVVQSNAMNGISSSTRVIVIKPWWITAVEVTTTVVTVLFAVSMAALGVAVIGDVATPVAEKLIGRKKKDGGEN